LSLNIGNDIFSGHEHINCLILNIILLQIDLLKSLSLLLNFAFNLQFNYSVLLLIFWWVWAASYCQFSNCMILHLLYVLLPLWNIEWMGVKYALLTHKLILWFFYVGIFFFVIIVYWWSLQCFIVSLGVYIFFLTTFFLFEIIIIKLVVFSLRNILCSIPSIYLKTLFLKILLEFYILRWKCRNGNSWSIDL